MVSSVTSQCEAGRCLTLFFSFTSPHPDKSPSPDGSTSSGSLLSIHFLPVAAACPQLWPDYCHSSCFQLPPPPPPFQPEQSQSHDSSLKPFLPSPLPSRYRLRDCPAVHLALAHLSRSLLPLAPFTALPSLTSGPGSPLCLCLGHSCLLTCAPLLLLLPSADKSLLAGVLLRATAAGH